MEDTPGLLCAELGIEEFAWLSQSCEPVELRAGETPIAAGDLADHFYILLGGELRATPRSGEPCRFLRRPDEPPLLIGAIFLKNLEAAADCRLLRVRDDGNIWIRAMIEGDGLAVEIADEARGSPSRSNPVSSSRSSPPKTPATPPVLGWTSSTPSSSDGIRVRSR